MKYILLVINQKEQTEYFGPFDDGEKALDWGEERFNINYYFLMSVPLNDPNKNKNDNKI